MNTSPPTTAARRRTARRLVGTIGAFVAISLGSAAPAAATSIAVDPNPAHFGDTVSVTVSVDDDGCALRASGGSTPDFYDEIWLRPDGTEAHREQHPQLEATEFTWTFQIPDNGPAGTWRLRIVTLTDSCDGPVGDIPFDVVTELEPVAASGWGPIVLGSLVALAGVAFVLHRRGEATSLQA